MVCRGEEFRIRQQKTRGCEHSAYANVSAEQLSCDHSLSLFGFEDLVNACGRRSEEWEKDRENNRTFARRERERILQSENMVWAVNPGHGMEQACARCDDDRCVCVNFSDYSSTSSEEKVVIITKRQHASSPSSSLILISG